MFMSFLRGFHTKPAVHPSDRPLYETTDERLNYSLFVERTLPEVTVPIYPERLLRMTSNLLSLVQAQAVLTIPEIRHRAATYGIRDQERDEPLDLRALPGVNLFAYAAHVQKQWKTGQPVGLSWRITSDYGRSTNSRADLFSFYQKGAGIFAVHDGENAYIVLLQRSEFPYKGIMPHKDIAVTRGMNETDDEESLLSLSVYRFMTKRTDGAGAGMLRIMSVTIQPDRPQTLSFVGPSTFFPTHTPLDLDRETQTEVALDEVVLRDNLMRGHTGFNHILLADLTHLSASEMVAKLAPQCEGWNKPLLLSQGFKSGVTLTEHMIGLLWAQTREFLAQSYPQVQDWQELHDAAARVTNPSTTGDHP